MRGGQETQRQPERISTETVTFIKKTTLILSGYTLTVLPFTITNFLRIYGEYQYGSVTMHGILGWTSQGDIIHAFYAHDIYDRFFFTILYCNTIIDVVAYSAFDIDFQNYVRGIFTCKIRSRNHQRTNVPTVERRVQYATTRNV